MDDRNINGLYELIFKSEMAEPNIRDFYDKLQPNIALFASQLHIARIDFRIEVEPNVYEVRGKADTFTNFYHDEVDGIESAMKLEYPALSYTKGTATVFPWKGHTWTGEEKKQIEAVLKLINISLSRCNMIRYQQEAPYIDLLTGLVNNEGIVRFGKRLQRNVKMSDYAGLFINLKNFKVLNQQLSQPGANAIMKEYALRLNNFLDTRKECVARLGGDNFFALIRKAHMEEFMALAMNMSLTTMNEGQNVLVNVRSRVGVYLAREKDTIDIILNNANFAFQRAKRAQQTVSYFDEELMNETMRAKKVSMIIPDAIEKGEFLPLYQPKVRASNSRLYGCEALCRWNHDGRMVSPGEFIPIAEMTGLISNLDQYMLECVCRDIRTWLDEGIEPVPVSVNFSQQDFFDEQLIQKTLDTINRYNVDGKYLEIEITESCFHENYAALEDFVKIMHENGIRVSLDDFGTGYSSLSMFKNLELDVIKLDKSFFDDLDEKGDTDRVILESISKMINRLNKISVSEGVETEEQLKFAKQIGSDIIQGFYFDRPLNFEDFTRRLKIRTYETQKEEK